MSQDRSSYQTSSSATTGTLSSMETVPTQEVDGCFGTFSDGDEDIPVWGRLFPLGSSFVAHDLTKEEYTFGRADSCDFIFPNVKGKCQSYRTYSSIHFKIFRQQTSTGVFIFLEDTSSNGTFVNGSKVGKGNKQVLSNNDEIALSVARNKAYIYMDANNNDDNNFPESLREKYTITKVLGRGAAGEVRLAFEKGTCKTWAIKIIQKRRFSIGGKNELNLEKQVINEVNILKGLKHPCIISIEDVIDTPECVYIVLELVEGGELFDRVVSKGFFEENIAKLLFHQMLLAVKYLHDQGITHRDLKPENILLATDENETLVKVTDFGLSKFVDANTMMKTFCGTPNYLAPEILETQGHGKYTNAIDCWSLGVILFICLVGYPPFGDVNKDVPLAKQIMRGMYSFPAIYWKDVSSEAKDLVKQLLTVNPEKRATVEQALNHSWFQDDEMLKKVHDIMYPTGNSVMLPPKNPATPKKRPPVAEESSRKRTKISP
ncbi:serine/threonine-protein kinase Chk2 [Lingula anatina]|uniref:Serine/threonine-protein kinase Chk2 n=1 Tax=Lingula anatina TaxID=7574 RepID=A0A1S3HKX9_LINAN|nr:serine/threonine-protein kinase Chk2 [Lingula anatina]|eukprot:XP_013386116.1 serine/threonine-protein kinase Chk2 [Lingula anatina]